MNRAILGLATDQGIIVLKPGKEATEYTRASHGLMSRNCPCVIRSGDGRLVAGTDDFFVQHSRQGHEWKASLEGLNRPQITALARHPKHNMLLFAGSSSPAVFMSQDFGETWKALSPLESLPSTSLWSAKAAPFRAKVSSISCHSEHAGVLLVAIEIGGLAASKDGGKTWFARDKDLPREVRKIIAPPVKGRIYAATGEGFYRTDDLGATWHDKTKGLPYRRIQALAIADSNPDIIVMSITNPTETLGALVQSKNGGESWEMTTTGLPGFNDRMVTALAFGRGGFYAGTNRGDLFGLDNMEGRWTRLGTNYPAIHDLITLA